MLENDTNMSGWKKIHIALIIIVDGVLIAHKQKPRPTPRYVRLVENLQKKFPFPWGTEKLKQFSFRLQGFPLLLQLVAFHAIPQLMDYIPAPSNSLTVMDLEDGLLPAIYHNTPQSLPSTSDAWNLPPIWLSRPLYLSKASHCQGGECGLTMSRKTVLSTWNN
ncbi:unnamed protein product [Brassica oleracea]